MAPNSEQSEEESPLRTARTAELPRLTEPHPNFPSFSASVSVRHERGRGRYCVASRRIEVGDGKDYFLLSLYSLVFLFQSAQ